MTDNRKEYADAVNLIRARINVRPVVGLVLGSGLGELAETLVDPVAIPYDEIPGWPVSTVHGHAGRLVIGSLEGKVVAAQQGRAHFYEGYSTKEITFPIRVMYGLGITTLILTNAAGGINPAYKVGDLMLLNDHINLIGIAGHNPLVGPNDDAVGPRFVSMVHTYDAGLRRLAAQVAREADVLLHEGVYAAVSGPAFETPAEIRMLRVLGADAVGMSTVHEVLVARHANMRVMACSGITNVAVDRIDSDLDTNHEEVLEAGKVLVPRLTAVLKGVLRRM